MADKPQYKQEMNCKSLCTVAAMFSLLMVIAGLGCWGIDLWNRYRGANVVLVDTAMQECGAAMIVDGVGFFALFGLLCCLLKH
ncbi:MAG TPA: hypothetical protein VFG04_15765 [Planctomycetaceae bacterium]|nr:hypothetical protein [Planctomycetaceae bacterium]